LWREGKKTKPYPAMYPICNDWTKCRTNFIVLSVYSRTRCFEMHACVLFYSTCRACREIIIRDFLSPYDRHKSSLRRGTVAGGRGGGGGKWWKFIYGNTGTSKNRSFAFVRLSSSFVFSLKISSYSCMCTRMHTYADNILYINTDRRMNESEIREIRELPFSRIILGSVTQGRTLACVKTYSFVHPNIVCLN